MSQFNIAEAKAQLSELTRRALAGEEIIIARPAIEKRDPFSFSSHLGGAAPRNAAKRCAVSTDHLSNAFFA